MTANMRQRWTEDHVIACDEFYRRFGRRRAADPEVVRLSRKLRRTPGAVAAKVAQLAEAHEQPGYPGERQHFTKMDRRVVDR
jgi:hypothetical protein